VLPEGLRITEPAVRLARELGVNLHNLPAGPLVTEKMVRTANQGGLAAPRIPAFPFDPTALIIYGGGGHGKSLIDLVRSMGAYRIVGVIDDGISGGTSILGVPVLGGAEKLPDLHASGVRLALNAVGGIGNISIRMRIFERLADAGFVCPTVIHPSAVIEPSAILDAGIQVMPHAYIGSEAHIGYGAIINTGAIVSHECQVGEFANLSPGSILAGQVQVGAAALLGMGVTVNLQVKIGRMARIGNSAVIKQDVPNDGVVKAGATWPD
jgi:sugar O-acyltransferase (sialic acid O-acetyltransferase NeuD family)